ncbi:PSD1 and planctomycete cytochrome C domain-containing protein [Planctomycetes bacterium K23_9]|uniref:Planctomycete cytochrome C n=1 Tax=Stieleria marina TaxID=1930275 RepID=A0A517NTF5_9BACT|nr:Planctomycete cytochrome C [Planctomycetes bacterium K23_9]
MRSRFHFIATWLLLLNTAAAFLMAGPLSAQEPNSAIKNQDKMGAEFFERRIRPILVQHCYECHSETAGEQQGGLLLDRQAGWIEGGDSNKTVIPGEPDASLLMVAVRYERDDLQMPPDEPLSEESIALLEQWIAGGAPGPLEDMGETEFSRLGDQPFIFEKSKQHWAFQPVTNPQPPQNQNVTWNDAPIDQFVFARMQPHGLQPSHRARSPELYRRLNYVLTGLPPSREAIETFEQAIGKDRDAAIQQAVDQLLDSPAFGQHIARMWLDVTRYADTDSAYRADTKTPHYFPFAFSYRDYVVNAFNEDKPYDKFLKEQFAADLLGAKPESPEMAALGFLGVAPHANRAASEALDDWIDLTTRGLLGLTVACARCHDHKYEPIPTVDYYSLRGVFGSLDRPHPLDEKKQPLLAAYQATPSQRADYRKKRATIDKKIADAEGQKAKGNNRSVAQKIRETDLAELLLFHPGAPARSMVVREKKKRPRSFVHIRGDARARGEDSPARFLKVLEPEQRPFDSDNSGRLELVNRIANPENPLTARVYVNRIWGWLIGSHLVDTPSDFGLQGSPPTHPELLDYLAADFVRSGWSTKRLVRQIVTSETFAQSICATTGRGPNVSCTEREGIDPTNRYLWRANRRHLSIEAIRDSVLAVSGQLDQSLGGHAEQLWPAKAGAKNYARRRTIYGYINRFNLDPTLRAFDFPSPMQTQPTRGESIVAPQALFLMNSPFVSDQMQQLVQSDRFTQLSADDQKIDFLFDKILQRSPANNERTRVSRFVEFQQRIVAANKNPNRFKNDPWPLVAQSLVMSNEFQYLD